MHTTNAITLHYSTEEQNVLARFASRIRRADRRDVHALDHGSFQVFAVL
jgi:hypothetical protein